MILVVFKTEGNNPEEDCLIMPAGLKCVYLTISKF